VQTRAIDAERQTWIVISVVALTKTWSSPADDVSNALLQKS
jgi:hypothetical protein